MPNFCSYGGIVVAGDRWLPTDPSDYSHWTARDMFGCTHLRCPRCGEAVRDEVDLRLSYKVGPPRDHARILGETSDWTALPWVEQAPSIRLYACSCHAWDEATGTRIDPPDWEPGDPVFPWRCGGHPEATLPLELDGLTLDEATDWDALVGPVLLGEPPAGASEVRRGMPVNWLCRLYTRLLGLPQAEQVALAISRRLTASEHETGEALAFYERWPTAPGFDGVVRLAEQVGADRGYPFRVYSSFYQRAPVDALGSRLQHAGPEPDELDRAAGRMLRELLLAGNKVVENDHLLDLVIVEAEWVARNILELVDGRPSRVPKLLDALLASGRTELLVVAGVALAGAKKSARARLRTWLRENPYDDTPWALVMEQSLGGGRKR